MTSPTATAEIERLIERFERAIYSVAQDRAEGRWITPNEDEERDEARGALLAALRAAEAERDGLRALLQSVVDEFGGSIQQYHKSGPDYTFKDGTEVFEVATLLDRSDLIDEARAALQSTSAKEGGAS